MNEDGVVGIEAGHEKGIGIDDRIYVVRLGRTHIEADEEFLVAPQRRVAVTPRQLFTEWNPNPISVASVGQVHRATFPDGSVVACKVQYPGIVQALHRDLELLASLDLFLPLLFPVQEPGVLLDAHRHRALEECDYNHEARNLQQFSRIFEDRPDIVIPQVFPSFSGSSVLTMSFAEGDGFQEVCEAAPQDRRNRIAEQIFDFYYTAMLQHEIVNIDPHPGNFVFSERGTTFLDFGRVQRFRRSFIVHWKQMLRALFYRDMLSFEKALISMEFVPDAASFDFGYAYRLMILMHKPWLVDRPFAYDRTFLLQIWAAYVRDNPNRRGINFPEESVFLHQIAFGTVALFARLRACFDVRAKVLPLLFERGETVPTPFSDDELAESVNARVT